MNKQDMLKKLKKYVKDNYKTQTAYASFKGFSNNHINDILLGNKEPTKNILKDIGLEKVVTKKVSYIPCVKNHQSI